MIQSIMEKKIWPRVALFDPFWHPCAWPPTSGPPPLGMHATPPDSDQCIVQGIKPRTQ